MYHIYLDICHAKKCFQCVFALIEALYLVKQHIILTLVMYMVFGILIKNIRITVFLVLIILKVHLNDMLFIHPMFQKIITEKSENQKGLATPTDAGDNFYHTIVLSTDKLIQIV